MHLLGGDARLYNAKILNLSKSQLYFEQKNKETNEKCSLSPSISLKYTHKKAVFDFIINDLPTHMHLLLGDAYFFMLFLLPYRIDSQRSLRRIMRLASSTTSVCSEAK